MLIEILKPDFEFKNDAGLLVQLVHEGWKQINFIGSVANCTRGNHYHKYNKEAFYVISGKFRLVVQKDGLEEEYYFSAGDMFLIPPCVNHIFEYLEETRLIGLYDRGVEMSESEKDIWPGGEK